MILSVGHAYTLHMENTQKETEVASKVRVHFWIPRQLYNYIEYVSKRDERTLSEIVREALRDFTSKDRKLTGEDSGSKNQ